MTRDRQQAALDRLRAKGNHLAPVMVDGKVRPKQASAFQPFELIIPAPAEWLNENQRLNRWEKARRVKTWRLAAAMHAKHAGIPAGLPRVRIDAYVVKPIANNYDPANWSSTAKAVTDGMVVDYGLCEDDNRKHVEGPFMHDGGKGSPALRLVVTPLPANVTAA